VPGVRHRVILALPQIHADLGYPARPVLLALFLGALGPLTAVAQDQAVPPPPVPAQTPPPVSAQPPPGWIGLHGSGLFTLPDTQTLPPGRFVAGITVDNRDRDPLGLDLLDGAVAWSAGLGTRLEAYGKIVASRVVTVPGRVLPLPPPPVDLIVPAAMTPPRRPYYPLFSLTPYVNDRGTARFSAWVPGDAIFAVKMRLAEPRGWRPGMAVAGELTLPMPYGLVDLQSGAGTGSVDQGVRAVAEWRLPRTSVVASALFVRTGSAPFGDRLVTLESGGAEGSSSARIADLPLTIPNRLELGLGARRSLRPWLAAVLEGTAAVEVGYRTRALDRITPLDGLAGAQLSRGRVRLTAALRYHGNALRTGQVRPSPLAGAVDLTDVDPTELALYLRQAGAESALQWLRPRTQRLLLAPSPGVALPPRARIVPAQYVIESEHQVGFLLALGWAF
jgi:hypothetical protein